MDAPFAWTKQIASHFGGTRNPLVIHWPAGIQARGELREQFHHVIDVVPTILEACKIPAPTEVNGIRQKPIEGVSMMYSFEDNGSHRHAHDAVLRDADQSRDLSRWLDRVQSFGRTLGNGWTHIGRTQECNMGVVQRRRRLQPGQRPGHRESIQTERVTRPLHRRSRKRYNVLPLDPRMPNDSTRNCTSPANNRRVGRILAIRSNCPNRLGPNYFPGHLH